jgi:DUF1365 family protein
MYTGTIRHRRFAPRPHAFKYRIAMAWRDLGEGRRGFLSRREVLDLVGEPFDGEIRLLSYPFGFNPVAFYYGYEGDEVRWIVAQVTNTPWGEQHAYVLGGHGGTFDKAFHVSPFMAMDHTYFVRAAAPGATLAMHIESRRDGEVAFDATLNLRRRPRRWGALVVSTLRTLPLIYAHGVILALKGVPHHSHPRTETS